MSTIYDLIHIVYDSMGESYEKCMLFLLELVPMVISFLPEIGNEAFIQAKRYWIEKSIDSKQLTETRVKCWKYLDQEKATANLVSKKFCSLRAVMCLLHDDLASEEYGENIEFFMEMINYINEDFKITEGKVKEVAQRIK